MKLKMFTVYDSKAEAYLAPFYFTTVGQALRSFMDTCADQTHPFYLHAEDFTIFEIGSYENQDASFELHLTPLSIGKASEYKDRENE